MSRNVVTTEFVADQPLVVILHHGQFLATAFERQLSQEQVQIESHTLSELSQSTAIQARLASAYKLVWVTDIQFYLDFKSDFNGLEEILRPLQNKITIVLPVIGQFQEQVPGEIPFAQELFRVQAEAILLFNNLLPNAIFIFGQDIIDPKLELSAFSLLCQDLSQAKLYQPSINFHPQAVVSFLERAKTYFLKPQHTSTVIKGNSVKATEVVKQLKQRYQSYHFSPLDIQEVLVSSQPTIPFSVVENFVTDDAEALITNFAKSLPSPRYVPAVSVWETVFGPLIVAASVNTKSQPVKEAQELWLGMADLGISESEPTPTPTSQPNPNQFFNEQPEETEKAGSRLKTTSQTTTDDHQTPNEQFDLNQEIQQLFTKTHLGHQRTQKKKTQTEKKTISKRSKKRTTFFYSGLAFTGMGLGIVSLAVVFMVSVQMLRRSVSDFLVQPVSGDPQNLSQNLAPQLKRLSKIVGLQTDTYSTVLSLPALEEAQLLASISDNLINTTEQSLRADQLAEMLYLQSMGLDSGDVLLTTANLSTQAVTAYENLSTLYAELADESSPLLQSDQLSAAIQSYGEQLKQKKDGLAAYQQISPLIGDWLGVNQKRTYAVLLQNNQELRPTGGFLEDVALLTFNQGTLTSIRVLSSEEIDKQLGGLVVPPEEIKKYLGEKYWHFFDSNWNPNFPDAANQITWFLEKSLGVDVDGVLTIDLYGLENILEKTGPLDLPDYNEVVTHKNLQDQFEFHSEVSLVDNKEDYRKKVFEEILKKISTLPKEKAIPLFAALQQNFAEYHILASFKAADEQNTVKALGWSGALLQPDCPPQLEADNCLVDVAAQIEANVGINKANYYLERTIDDQVALTATQAAHIRTITYHNTAQTESWPKGSYKVFARLYLPAAAIGETVLIDGKPIEPDSLSVKNENLRRVIGFFLEVPVKESRAVVITYTLPFQNQSKAFSYAFFEQQQPGFGQTPFSLQIKPAAELKPVLIAPQAEFKNNVASFYKDSVGHSFYGISFK